MISRSTAQAAGRLAARGGREFVRHVVPSVIKPARALWNEFIGFVFLCLAGFFGFKAGRLAWDYMKAGPEGGFGQLVRLVIAGFCTLVVLYFGITSLLQARKISRS